MSSSQHIQKVSAESSHGAPPILVQPPSDSGSDTETESVRKDHKKHKHKDKHHRHHANNISDPDSSPLPTEAMMSTPSRSVRRLPSKSKAKTDDWSDVTNPEERRRIQNRIAQRKFREKAREQKERAERDLRNQEHAASSYQVPGPLDLDIDDELSGVPWGGPSLRFVVAKGHESMSNQGSRRASDYLPDDTAAVAAAAAAAAASGSGAHAAAYGIPAGHHGSSGSSSSRHAASGDAAVAWADAAAAADYGMYTFGSSADSSQASSSRSSGDYVHPHDPSYFGESPYYYD